MDEWGNLFKIHTPPAKDLLLMHSRGRFNFKCTSQVDTSISWDMTNVHPLHFALSGQFWLQSDFFRKSPPPIWLRPRRGPTGAENFEVPPIKNLEKKPCPCAWISNGVAKWYRLCSCCFHFGIKARLGWLSTETAHANNPVHTYHFTQHDTQAQVAPYHPNLTLILKWPPGH